MCDHLSATRHVIMIVFVMFKSDLYEVQNLILSSRLCRHVVVSDYGYVRPQWLNSSGIFCLSTCCIKAAYCF